MSTVNPGVYRAVLRVRQARRFDIGGFLMRLYAYMMSVGTVTMLTLSGYSFLASGLVASLIAFSIFLLSPRISKLVDERGQSKVVPLAALVALVGLAVMLANAMAHGPEWVFFPAALLMGCLPSAQALTRARWTYLLRMGRVGADAPSLRTVFSYEGVIDDVAFMFGPSFAIALASAVAPTAGLMAGGVIFVVGVGLLVSSKATEPEPGWDAGQGEAGPESAGGASIMRTSPTVRVLFVLMLLTGGFYGMFGTTSVALSEALGDPNIAGIGLMAASFLSAAVGFLFGMVRLRAPLYRQLTLCAVLIGCAYGFMALVNGQMAFYIVACCGSLFYAPFLIVINNSCEQAVPGSRLTEALTWINSGMTCGVALGPTLSGVLVDIQGYSLAYGAGAILALAVAAVALLGLPLTRKHLS